MLFALWCFDLPSDIVAVFLFGVMIVSAAHNNDWLSGILNTKFLKHMGDISYSLYMVHMLLVLLFSSVCTILVNPDPLLKITLGYAFPPLEAWIVEAWIGLVIMFAACIALASLTYAYIEKPARTHLNSKIKHTSQPQ